MKYNHFINEQDELAIQKDGYTLLPLLDAGIVEELSLYYSGLSSPYEKGFHPSMFWKDPVLKQQISEKICKSLQDFVSQYFKGFRLLYGNFMVKQPGEESRMKLHQDWAYVDENHTESYAIWFPLQDLNSQNGALCMVPGSHGFKNLIRGPGTYCPFESQESWIAKEYGKTLFLKKGQPVVWQHRVLHYSPANLSQQPRVAVTAILVPNNEPVYHFYKEDSSNVVEQYQVEDSFYFHYDIGKRPVNFVTLMKEIKEEKFILNAADIKAILGSKPAKKWWKFF